MTARQAAEQMTAGVPTATLRIALRKLAESANPTPADCIAQAVILETLDLRGEA